MEFDTRLKLALYRDLAASGTPPRPADLAREFGVSLGEIAEGYARLADRRLLVLELDGLTVRMAPPFSGVPTQHRVRSGGVEYYANCAWDALGVCAALRREGEVLSRCEQSREPLRLAVGRMGPEHSEWLFHCEVPAAHWWKDIVFT